MSSQSRHLHLHYLCTSQLQPLPPTPSGNSVKYPRNLKDLSQALRTDSHANYPSLISCLSTNRYYSSFNWANIWIESCIGSLLHTETKNSHLWTDIFLNLLHTDQNEFIIDDKDSCNGLQIMRFWTNTGLHLYFV